MGSRGSPPLCKALADLKILGNDSVVKHRFIMCASASSTSGIIAFSSFVDDPSGPSEAPFFKQLYYANKFLFCYRGKKHRVLTGGR